MSRVADLYREAGRVYQTEGFVRLLRRALRFLVYCVLEYRSYWLSCEPVASLPDSDEADFLPDVERFAFHIVSSNQEADELEAKGLEFRSHVPNGRERLDREAVALCAFAERSLVGISWLALSQRAKDTFSDPPYQVRFSTGEACVGDGWTSPDYRRMGLGRHRAWRTNEFLRERGVVAKRMASRRKAVRRNHTAPLPGRNTYAEGRYLRFLWWKSWKETPLSRHGQEAIGQEDEPRS